MDEKKPLGNEPEEEALSEQSEDKISRMDTAKAFFRGMNAGTTAESQLAACPNCSQMEIRIKELENKVFESDALYKRMAADFENYRRRIDKEREEYLSIGIQKVVEALLPGLDDIERAKSTLDANMSTDKLLQSLELVYNRINQCLEQVGLKAMSALGESFDPKYHEPVQQIETTDFPDGSIMQELRRGYMLNDRVVRPVLVNVAQNVVKKGKATKEKSQHNSAEAENVEIMDSE